VRKSLIGLLIVAATVAAALLLPAVARADSPTYYTGQADYSPEQVVDFHGAGYAPNTTYEVPVLRPDGSIVIVDPIFHTATPGWQETTTDGSGNLTYNYQLDGIQGSYTARVYPADWNGDWSQTPIAQTTFTDAAAANLDQCANGPLSSPTGCNPDDWVNGNVGASKAHYFEGDFLPYRLTMNGLANAAGISHTVTIEWDTTKSSKHALDYIGTFNNTVTTADPCAGVSNCGSPTTFAIPNDPQVTGAGVTPPPGQVFTLYGGTITNVSTYSYADGTGFTGDKSAQLTITFTATKTNPVLAWAGHISTRADWGADNSAVAISGSPYHTRLIDLDGSGGNQDRSLSADAVIFPGSIKIIKDAQPNGSTSFSFTGSPSPLTNFSLVDDGTSANTKLFSNIIDFQTYTVQETPIPTGWALTDLVCSVTSANGGSSSTNLGTGTATLNMKEGENYTCTYTDVLQRVTLHVIKHVINDNGGTKTASDFTMNVTGGNPSPASFSGAESPGTTVSIDANTAYSVGENAVSGYTQTGATAGCSSQTGIPAGGSATCTITNDDQAAKLIVIKHVVNDDGGSAVASDFTMNVTGSSPSPSSFPGTESPGTSVAISPGSDSVSETGPYG
jgi:hypothetical protein